MAIKNLLVEDDREIHALRIGEISYTVGFGGITRIIVGEVAGEMAMVPWFTVYRGDVIAYRINAAHVHVVEYAERKS